MKLYRSLATMLLASFAALPALHGQETSAPKNPTVEAARTKYAAANWPSGPCRAGFVLEELTLPDLTGQAVEFNETDVGRLYADASGKSRVLVEMQVCDSAAQAHEALLFRIAMVESTKTLPTAAARGIQAGDIGYIGYGGRTGDKIAWLAFAVGNLQFRVVNLAVDAEGSPDVRPLVELLAAKVAALPGLADGAPLPTPAFQKFGADKLAITAGGTIVLDLVATDPTGKSAAFDFVIGGPGQGFVEPDAQGRPVFHATGAGRTTITARALGRNGTTATKALELTITAR